MTTIAYDGKSLATDSRSFVGDEIYEEDCQKLYLDVGPFAAIANAGNCQQCRDVMDLLSEFKSIKQVRKLDLPDKGWDNVQMIAVAPDGSVWKFQGTKTFELRTDLPFAMGSGCEHAITAMDMGATASEAVLMAAKRDSSTNTVIQSVSFTRPPEELEEPIAGEEPLESEGPKLH